MTEHWLPIPGYTHYDVSDEGRVRSWYERPFRRTQPQARAGRPHLRSLQRHKEYMTVMLKQDGVLRLYEVHRLVALAFLGAPPEGREVAHLDGKGTNNFLSNLQYKTKADNESDKVAHGTLLRGEHHYATVLSDEDVANIRRYVAAGGFQKDAAVLYGVSKQHISDIINNKRRKIT